jgi:CheY-like chemotaxis protein
MKVLYVDDDIEDQEIFLEAVKCVDKTTKCVTCSSVTKAFAILAIDDFDFIFVDFRMPVMDGKSLLPFSKKAPPGFKIQKRLCSLLS